jgi:hypothetical protein
MWRKCSYNKRERVLMEGKRCVMNESLLLNYTKEQWACEQSKDEAKEKKPVLDDGPSTDLSVNRQTTRCVMMESLLFNNSKE